MSNLGLNVPFEERYTTKSCTRAEALTILRKAPKRTTVFIKGGTFLVIANSEEDGKQRGFEGIATVVVSRKIAAKYITDILSEKLEERGARLRVCYPNGSDEYAPCLFLG